MRLKILAYPPECSVWSQPQNLSKGKQLFEAKRIHSRKKSRKGINSRNTWKRQRDDDADVEKDQAFSSHERFSQFLLRCDWLVLIPQNPASDEKKVEHNRT